jgi:FKBP-type peptidyl-prolyl cis-trans isomerase 2/CheY-like chemotaxis protein
VHYVKRLQDGAVASSRGRGPLRLTVGIDDPRLPGLGLALVGLAAGESATLSVPPEQAYGMRDPGRVRRLDRRRFPRDQALAVGKWIRVLSRRGPRLVRVIEVRDDVVVVDVNHRGAGQALQLKVKVLAIRGPVEPAGSAEGPQGARRREGSPSEDGRPPDRPGVIAFDADAATLDSLRRAFPDWRVQAIHGADTGSLSRDWNPGAADLLVVSARTSVADTLGLCRGLRSQAGRALTPLLVLVPPAGEALARAALEAGANSCLVLPVHVKDLVRVVTRALEGNRPGRHTLGLDRAQSEDRWRDDGGEG